MNSRWRFWPGPAQGCYPSAWFQRRLAGKLTSKACGRRPKAVGDEADLVAAQQSVHTLPTCAGFAASCRDVGLKAFGQRALACRKERVQRYRMTPGLAAAWTEAP